MIVPRENRGLALPLVLMALVVLGVAAGSLLWAALVEVRSGDHIRRALAARQGAEVAWPEALRGADSAGVFSLVPGDSVALAPRPLAGGARSRAVVYRTGGDIYLIASSAEFRAPGGRVGARYQVQVLARRDSVPDGSAGGWKPVLAPVGGSFWSSLVPQ